jgi:hypothetical protein
MVLLMNDWGREVRLRASEYVSGFFSNIGRIRTSEQAE